jgi:hypothetical protein
VDFRGKIKKVHIPQIEEALSLSNVEFASCVRINMALS